MAGIHATKLGSGKYRGWYKDRHGKRIFFKGTTDKRETLRMAQKLEDDHIQVAQGYREEKKPWEHSADKEYAAVAIEYMAWGKEQGGLNGHPWGFHHARKKQSYLNFWQKALGLKTLRDMRGILAATERVLREMRTRSRDKRNEKSHVAKKPSGKTLTNYVDGLSSFCEWLVERGMLQDNPLNGISTFDKRPRTQRRAMDAQEIKDFFESLEHGPAEARRRRLGYELALVSGLRADELRHIRVELLDVERGGIVLEATWTKNRKDGFQPLPRALVQRLEASAKGRPKSETLVFVARDSAEALKKDLLRAGIQPMGPGGKIDFHALRVAYTTFLCDSGADIKTVQTLARHSTPALTMNIYAKARTEKLSETAEVLGKMILPPECAAGVQAKAAGAEQVDVIAENSKTSEIEKKRSVRDSNPRTASCSNPQSSLNTASNIHPNRRISTRSMTVSAMETASKPPPRRNITSIKPHEKCAAGVHADSDDLALVREAWHKLPEHARQTILAIVSASAPKGGE